MAENVDAKTKSVNLINLQFTLRARIIEPLNRLPSNCRPPSGKADDWPLWVQWVTQFESIQCSSGFFRSFRPFGSSQRSPLSWLEWRINLPLTGIEIQIFERAYWKANQWSMTTARRRWRWPAQKNGQLMWLLVAFVRCLEECNPPSTLFKFGSIFLDVDQLNIAEYLVEYSVAYSFGSVIH